MTKKHRIRIGIIIAIICVMSFSDWSFADEQQASEKIQILGFSLSYIVSLISWLWIILAKVAGEFLTNRWVYGEFLGLDVLLRKFWHIVKNFANFGLGFYFVYIIFKGLISSGKDGVEQKLKHSLLRLLLAGIGIQSSRFLTSAVIDISTVTLSAAGTLPSIIISNNIGIENSVKSTIENTFGNGAIKAELFNTLKDNQFFNLTKVELEKEPTDEEVIDALMPKPEDVSGPLYFIGVSILNISNITSIDSSNKDGWMATIFNIVIQGGTTIIYGIELLVLCIVAVMRIIYLWMFIMLSPIAILLRCIQQSGEKIGGGDKGILSKLTTQINFETLLINVFKPTIVVLGLGIAALFASLMSDIIRDSANKSFYMNSTEFRSYEDSGENKQTSGDTTYKSVINHNLFMLSLAHVGKTLLELVLSIITVVLVYQIIRIAMTMGNGKDFVGKRIDSIQDSVGKVLGSAPIIPVEGFDKEGVETTHYIGASKVFGLGGEQSLLGTKLDRYKGKIQEVNDKDAKIIRSWFGDETDYLTQDEKTAIENAGTSKQGIERLEAKKDAIPKSDNGKGMNLLGTNESSRFWIGEFTKWLNNVKESQLKDDNNYKWRTMKIKWEGLGEKEKTLDNLFSGSDSTNIINTYVKFFLGDKYVGQITNRNTLAPLDISKEKQDIPAATTPGNNNGTTPPTSGNNQTNSGNN